MKIPKLKWKLDAVDNIKSCEFKIPLGRIYIYIHHKDSQRHKLEVFWQTLEGSDRLVCTRNLTGSFDDCVLYALETLQDYFEDHKELSRWYKSLTLIQDIRQSL